MAAVSLDEALHGNKKNPTSLYANHMMKKKQEVNPANHATTGIMACKPNSVWDVKQA